VVETGQTPAARSIGIPLGVAQITARLERLPYSSWHVRARVIVGVATFFDAFDALAIAYVLPALIGPWHLTPQRIGLLISVGYVGQLVGAIGFGWLAERIGRLRTTVLTIATYAALSFLCALSWDYTSLFVFRTLQGLGLGGEVPVAAAYINEWAKAKGRGRFVLLYELIFPVGLVAAALLGFWIVPTFGWRYMFLIGALPAVLALVLRWLLPESPRWLAAKGRLEEADRILSQVESIVSRGGKVALPPVQAMPAVAAAEARTCWGDLFRGIYLSRTLAVWVIWFASYFTTYGMTTWLPTLYRTIFKFPLPQALKYSLLINVAGLAGTAACALLIDWTGRRTWFAMAFAGGGLSLGGLWYVGASDPRTVLLYASVSFFFISSISLAVYLYTPEIYPTRMRALGSSVASAWLRVASAIGPSVVGFTVGSYGLANVFLVFGLIALVGGVIAGLFGTETKGRVLEEVSP